MTDTPDTHYQRAKRARHAHPLQRDTTVRVRDLKLGPMVEEWRKTRRSEQLCRAKADEFRDRVYELVHDLVNAGLSHADLERLSDGEVTSTSITKHYKKHAARLNGE